MMAKRKIVTTYSIFSLESIELQCQGESSSRHLNFLCSFDTYSEARAELTTMLKEIKDRLGDLSTAVFTILKTKQIREVE